MKLIESHIRVDGLGITHIEVTLFSENGLQKYFYRFVYKNHSLVPRAFVSFIRSSKRHKFESVDVFGGTDRRYDTLNSMPKVPEKVREQAHTTFFETLDW